MKIPIMNSSPPVARFKHLRSDLTFDIRYEQIE